jgi:competence protein ComEC
VITLTIFFISGILFFHYITFFPLSITTAFIISFFIIIKKRAYGRAQVALLFCFFLCGFLRAFHYNTTLPATDLVPGKMVFEGAVSTVPEKYDEYMSFEVDKVKLEGAPVQGRLRLYGSLSLPVSGGDYIVGYGSIKPPVMLHNPGVSSFNPAKQGIRAIGSVYEIYGKGKIQGLRYAVERKRQSLREVIAQSLGHDEAAVVSALILGLRGQISPQLKDNFSASGVAHLLSISGAHFGLLSVIVFWLLRISITRLPGKILLPLSFTVTASEVAALLTILVLILYLFMSGFRIPSIRAFIMIFTYFIALVLQRKGQLINCLALAAFIILLWRPDSLFDVSFQLSFLAVLSIGLYLRKTEPEPQAQIPEQKDTSFTHLFIEKNIFSFMITLSAILGTAPVVITVFNSFSVIAPVSNLIIAPLVCFIILPLTFLSSLLVLVFNLTFLPFSEVIEILVSFTLKVIKWFSSVPFFHVYLPDPSFFMIIIYLISLALLNKFRTSWAIFFFVLVIFVYLSSHLIFSQNPRVTFLDSGQADSAVIEFPDKRVMVIDGGTLGTGRRALVPYLKSRGIRHIDFLVLSHPHPDHYGGLSVIDDYFSISEFWYNGRVSAESREFIQTLIAKNIPLKVLKRGDAIVSDNYSITVLHPYNTFYAGSQRGLFSNENNDSLVLKIRIYDTSFLFTGDIEEEAEWDISHLGQWLKSDIIKVPHHGGRTSSSTFFISLVKPEVAVISTGRNNPFDHPHEEVLHSYRASRIMRTDRDGAVVFALLDSGYRMKTSQDFQLKRVTSLKDEMRNLLILLGHER